LVNQPRIRHLEEEVPDFEMGSATLDAAGDAAEPAT
jgi:hypothetical protein